MDPDFPLGGGFPPLEPPPAAGAGPHRESPHVHRRRDSRRHCYTWTKIPILDDQVPPPRSGAASVVTTGPGGGARRLWVFGGYGGNVARMDDFYYFDFGTGRWHVAPVQSDERPGPRENNGVVLSDSSSSALSAQSIYLFGGYNGNCWLNDLWTYSIETSRWTCLQESSDPDPSMEDAMGGVLADRRRRPQQPPPRNGGGAARAAPSRRFGYVSVVHQGKFVLFGGFDGTRWLNDTWVFSLDTNTWQEVQAQGDLPSVRSCPAWAKDDRCVYVLGGYDGVERKNDFFAMDLATYTWTQMPCLGTPPSPRYFHSCCLYAGKLYLYGGYSGTERLADMYMYDFDTHHWATIDCTAGDAPSGRSSLVAQVHEDSLYVFGGYNGLTVLNDFYRFSLANPNAPPKLVHDMSRLLRTPDLADIGFCVEGQVVYANRAILAIRSEYFRVMLCGGMRESSQSPPRRPSSNAIMMEDDDDTEDDRGQASTTKNGPSDPHFADDNDTAPRPRVPEIDLPNVSLPVFRKVLEYLYTDKVENVSLDLGIQLLIASEQFMLDRLKNLCEDIIRRDIDVNNVLGILVASHQHNAGGLKGITLDFVLHHLNDPVIMTGLSELRQEPDLLLEIIKRNAGNQTGSPARIVASPMMPSSDAGPFGQGSDWSARR